MYQVISRRRDLQGRVVASTVSTGIHSLKCAEQSAAGLCQSGQCSDFDIERMPDEDLLETLTEWKSAINVAPYDSRFDDVVRNLARCIALLKAVRSDRIDHRRIWLRGEILALAQECTTDEATKLFEAAELVGGEGAK